MRILAGDVGGTKTLLALYEGERGALREVAAERFESAAYHGPAEMIAALRAKHPGAIDAAALGVAGPVEVGSDNDTCKTTNLPWRLDARALGRDAGIARVRLLNDFAAVALGLGELGPDQQYILQDRPALPGRPQAVLGAGTGLGEAILLPQEGLPRVLPTEGGHADFAPRDEDEIALLRFLLRRHERVSVERVVSGPGLIAIYEHVLALAGAASDLLDAADPAAAISEAAISETGTDPSAARALHLFLSLYGAEAGNRALKTLPLGGLYVAGGIAPKILGALVQSDFLPSFLRKGRMRPILEAIRVVIVLEPAVGLLGARRLAASLV